MSSHHGTVCCPWQQHLASQSCHYAISSWSLPEAHFKQVSQCWIATASSLLDPALPERRKAIFLTVSVKQNTGSAFGTDLKSSQNGQARLVRSGMQSAGCISCKTCLTDLVGSLVHCSLGHRRPPVLWEVMPWTAMRRCPSSTRLLNRRA